DRDGGSARKPAPSKGRFRPHVPRTLSDGGELSSGLAEKLMRARSEVDRMEYLSRLAHLELADLEAVLDAGGVDAEGDEEEGEEEDGEAEMAGRARGDGEEREAKRAKSEGEEVEMEVKREGREEVAERAESKG
ncbi:hypothetical protein C0991_000889, partial [Blastosporella zonata]